MARPRTWRLITDYVGAGKYLVSPEGVVVGTEYGVQRVPYEREAPGSWKAELGSRCLGVEERSDGTIAAGCTGGLFLLGAGGRFVDEKLFAEDLVHRPVPFGDGVLLVSRQALHFFQNWQECAWSVSLQEQLGESVKSVRVVNLFGVDEHAVLGAVDYDSGIGRVMVFSKEGDLRWQSDLGPLSELFRAGQAVFVWCLTGYGKFESHMTRLDGHEIWRQDFAGMGSVLPDGSLAMIVGTNESPQWDNWEYRRVSAAGKVEQSLPAKGRSATRPLCLDDGTVYFLGSVFYLDPTSSRVDYTNFLIMPQEALFQHLLGIRAQIPEYDVALQRVRAGQKQVEIVAELSGSYSVAEPKYLSGHVIFCDGPDLVGLAVD